jgi:hypothetical protein
VNENVNASWYLPCLSSSRRIEVCSEAFLPNRERTEVRPSFSSPPFMAFLVLGACLALRGGARQPPLAPGAGVRAVSTAHPLFGSADSRREARLAAQFNEWPATKRRPMQPPEPALRKGQLSGETRIAPYQHQQNWQQNWMGPQQWKGPAYQPVPTPQQWKGPAYPPSRPQQWMGPALLRNLPPPTTRHPGAGMPAGAELGLASRVSASAPQRVGSNPAAGAWPPTASQAPTRYPAPARPAPARPSPARRSAAAPQQQALAAYGGAAAQTPPPAGSGLGLASRVTASGIPQSFARANTGAAAQYSPARPAPTGGSGTAPHGLASRVAASGVPQSYARTNAGALPAQYSSGLPALISAPMAGPNAGQYSTLSQKQVAAAHHSALLQKQVAAAQASAIAAVRAAAAASLKEQVAAAQARATAEVSAATVQLHRQQALVDKARNAAEVRAAEEARAVTKVLKEQMSQIQAQKEQMSLIQAQKEQMSLIQAQKEQMSLIQAQKEQMSLIQAQKEQMSLIQAQNEQMSLIQAQKEQMSLIQAQNEQMSLIQKELQKEQMAAAQARAVAAERAAAAASLQMQVEAAEERARAAEERAAAEEGAAQERAAAAEHPESNASIDDSSSQPLQATATPSTMASTTPYWLELLAGRNFDPLGEKEVLSAMSEAAVLARSSALLISEEISAVSSAASKLDAQVVAQVERTEWLQSLDVSMWCRAAMALSEAASEAAGMAELTAMCDSGDDVSCRILSEQQEDTATWRARLGVPNWGEAAAVLSVAASDAAAVSAAALEALEGFGFLKNRHLINPSLSLGDDSE